MTDIEYAHQQSEIFQFWKDDEMKMFEKLLELNKQYLEESKAYQKNQKNDEPITLGLKDGVPYSSNTGLFNSIFWLMILQWLFDGKSNNEPHTENEKTAFLNGKISAYEKNVKGA